MKKWTVEAIQDGRTIAVRLYYKTGFEAVNASEGLMNVIGLRSIRVLAGTKMTHMWTRQSDGYPWRQEVFT